MDWDVFPAAGHDLTILLKITSRSMPPNRKFCDDGKYSVLVH